MMKYRFLLHSLSHTFVVVDITEIGLPTEIYPKEGKEQIVPSLRFQNWRDAEQYFSGLGARSAALEETSATLRKNSTAVLTILDR